MHEQDEIDLLNIFMHHAERSQGGYFIDDYGLDLLIEELHKFSTDKSRSS